MKTSHNWHKSTFGRVALFLGSVRLAVPVMVFVAAALAWGTYLESTAGAKTSRATVYGAWWFIGLMGLVCVSLVFAVVTRFPWKRKHTGFMIVHASLVSLIVGGFWSLFGRVEGQMPLQTGFESAELQTDREQIEALRHNAGQFEPIGAAELAHGATRARVGGLDLKIVGRWENIAEQTEVLDDGPAPLRAVAVSAGGPAVWVAESDADSAPASVQGLSVRVLPSGQGYEAPAVAASQAGPAFVLNDARRPLGEVGSEAVPGWTIVSITRFERAMVTSGGLVEAPASGRENPALEVVITDNAGTTEQHRAFAHFPDMIMSKTLEGSARSGARLVDTAASAAREQLVIHGTVPAITATCTGADGRSEVLTSNGQLPWSFRAGTRQVTITQQLARARAASRFVEAPKAEGSRPALLVSLNEGQEPIVLPWQGRVPVQIGTSATILKYGPRTVAIPFTVRLDEFRKVDYPGTEMAMSYESDVTVTLADGRQEQSCIHMNHPFKSAGWKVYQSGFMGTDVSIFSVMRDPGLPLTYLSCIGLCLGILVTFYSKALSAGHPGIPAPFTDGNHRRPCRLTKEPRHAASAEPRADSPAASPLPAGVGLDADPRLGEEPALDPGAGRRARHAPGHVRDAARRAADRPLEVVS